MTRSRRSSRPIQSISSIAFAAARYDKGGDDYLNCPFDEEEYARFYNALIEAQECSASAIRRNALV